MSRSGLLPYCRDGSVCNVVDMNLYGNATAGVICLLSAKKIDIAAGMSYAFTAVDHQRHQCAGINCARRKTAGRSMWVHSWFMDHKEGCHAVCRLDITGEEEVFVGKQALQCSWEGNINCRLVRNNCKGQFGRVQNSRRCGGICFCAILLPGLLPDLFAAKRLLPAGVYLVYVSTKIHLLLSIKPLAFNNK